MTTTSAPTWASRAPARPSLTTLLGATTTSAVALSALVLLGVLSGHVLLIPPMAASMALVAGAPTLPLAQPRNVIGGQLVSAVVGIGVGAVSHSLWAAAIAGGLALGAMLATRTSHSPAAATAVIGTLAPSGQVSFVLCAGLAATVLVAAGLVRSTVEGRAYPTYWW
ncbi:HPP family protein [Ruania halotolerans]|uniref:HPP family protein n=1 Tax=Ruania halotolerans TaxID=2897773 RepID=UPI001E5FAF47|nr:HPP family protein [Ruania halotolerans]UFU05424.1 HPP family protein [Ruania halotolerans]